MLSYVCFSSEALIPLLAFALVAFGFLTGVGALTSGAVSVGALS
jgi:hypothetical protein